jgi:TatD DNase family protein
MQPSPRYVDIGINLTHDSFDVDRDAVLSRAKDAGVTHMVVTGSSLASSPTAAALGAAHPGLLSSTAGVHPHHATELSHAGVEILRELLRLPQVVAVGECGLDYFRDFSPRAAQRAAFELQLELAAQTGKPLFLHERDAHDDFLAMLKAAGASRPHAVAHCFTGDGLMLERYLELGLHIGITGWICDERRGRHLLDLVRHIPAGRLMIETDAPYLLPRTLGLPRAVRRNEPMHLREVCRVIADARGESLVETATHTTATALEFFGLPDLLLK